MQINDDLFITIEVFKPLFGTKAEFTGFVGPFDRVPFIPTFAPGPTIGPVDEIEPSTQTDSPGPTIGPFGPNFPFGSNDPFGPNFPFGSNLPIDINSQMQNIQNLLSFLN